MRIPKARRKVAGWTLLELLVVAVIVAILVSITFSGYGIFRAKAADGTCTSHLRSLRVSLETYMQDKHEWPQPPLEIAGDEEKMWEFWIKELTPYDGLQKYWVCPTHVELFMRGRSPQDTPEYMGSFIPTDFDDHESTPYKWRQPWLIERGNFHGKGAKMLMPDGSIQMLPPQATGGRDR
ncbi:MAG: prepilin-type N-terminal cleavage/methylation domain-containing protein [Verrucomicrobiales bacterium]|nr:prepilin-type N-terminal cleavage/methylation domain-containing protein [Verrucomicrobiales bacterium]